jgi:hypothetical protein
MILREIIAAGRIVATVALLITNSVLVLNVAIVFMLLLVLIGTPVLWYFLPALVVLSRLSFTVFLFIVSNGALAAWVFGSPVLKLVLVIALLPSMFSFIVAAISIPAMLWRNALHKCVSAILLRFAERGPLVVIASTFGIIAIAIASLGKWLHWNF